MMVPAIEAVRLSRTFMVSTGTFRARQRIVTALANVSLSIPEGELYGLLGPNGAGKTSLIRILTTLLLPSGGNACVLGLDVARDARAIRRRIGFVFGGDRGLYYRISGRDNLRYFAVLQGLHGAKAKQRVDELLGLVDLSDAADRRVEGYSRGMKQRLHIARALLGEPAVLFLDEPTIGLDPVGARRIREVIRGLHRAGVTILLTTHYLFEADELCDRIGVLAGGRLLIEDRPEALKQRSAPARVIEVTTHGLEHAELEDLRALPAVRRVVVSRDGLAERINIELNGDTPPLDRIARIAGVPQEELRLREPTLEDAYVHLIGGDE